MESVYSTTEAAQQLGLSQAHIRRLMESAQMPGRKVGRDWIIFSLDYKRKRKPKGYRKLSDYSISEAGIENG
jgi:excisionase family DNA binding protein